VHQKELIEMEANKRIQPDHREINKYKSKFVRSQRRNSQYIKTSFLVDEEIEGQKVRGLFVAKFPGSSINPNKPSKNEKKVDIKLSRHVKPLNIGVNDIEVEDNDLGLLKVKKNAIKTRLIDSNLKQRRREKQFEYLEKHHDELFDKFGNYVGKNTGSTSKEEKSKSTETGLDSIADRARKLLEEHRNTFSGKKD
jgi:hypothetical protein